MSKLDKNLLILFTIVVCFAVLMFINSLKTPRVPTKENVELYLYDNANIVERGTDYILLEFDNNIIPKQDSIRIEKYIMLLKYYEDKQIFYNFYNN